MTDFTIYNTQTGAIEGTGSVPDLSLAAMRNNAFSQGAGFVPNVHGDPKTEYVNLATRMVTPKGGATATLNGHSLVNLPPHAVVMIYYAIGEHWLPSRHENVGDAIDLQLTHAGNYRVEIESPSQLTATFEIVVDQDA